MTELLHRGTTITVGPDKGDFVGTDSLILQKAVDELARRAPDGRGTLVIATGIYTMFDSLLPSVPMTIRGEPGKTVLRKCPQFRSRLAEDFELSEMVLRLEDASGLRVGMGVTIKDDQHEYGYDVTVQTVEAVEGCDVRLDRRPQRDYRVSREAWLQNSFPVISVSGLKDVVIEDVIVDGNLPENPNNLLDGCRGGGIYLYQVKRCTLRRCVARNFNGDGISWQMTEEVVVEDCEANGNTGLGFHIGTGGLQTAMRRCRSHNNSNTGLFLAWSVRQSRFEDNTLELNANCGISLGHKDTDNLFLNNRVAANAVIGIQFRDEPQFNAAHRCTLRGNLIEDNGSPQRPGIGVDIEGETVGTLLEANTIRDTRPIDRQTQLTAVHVGSGACNVTLKSSNKIEGEIKQDRPEREDTDVPQA